MKAHIRREPEDWCVSEELPAGLRAGIEAGVGEHLYVSIRKRGLNTMDVARRLADHFRLPLVAVGFAGRKDKHAVTEQWFSVHTPDVSAPEDSADGQGAMVKLLSSGRYVKKLRHGEHAKNHFRILLRDVTCYDGCIGSSMAAGFPNRFGPQRFGGGNVDEAISWVLNRRRRNVTRQQKGWHLSVLRSYLFNKVIDMRLQFGDIHDIVPGDFLVDGVPTGPLWGRGRSQTQGAALEIERAALADLADVRQALEYAGVNQARRKLYSVPEGLVIAADPAAQTVALEFSLPPGAYATAMLAHCGTVVDDAT